MAKKASQGLKSFKSALDGIAKIVDGVPVQLEYIADNARKIAVEKLANAEFDNMDFTQKHGGVRLANEIELIENKQGSSYTLVAGQNATEEIKYELYFAEYGAGLGATSSFVGSGYQGISDNRYSLGGDGHFHKDTSGEYWWYPNENYEGTGNYTNTSTPIHYMEEARVWAKKQFATTSKELKTAIRRAKRG